MKEFKKGDRVRVRYDFENILSGISKEIAQDYAGKEGVIISESNCDSYRVHIIDTQFQSDIFCFSGHWLTTDNEEKDLKVRLKDIKKLLL